MNRWLFALVILVLLAALAAYLAPDIYRGMLFKRDCATLLEAVRTGELLQVIAQLDRDQQTAVGTLISGNVPEGYQSSIASLKLASWERTDAATIWAIVTLRLEEDGNLGIYQGKLRWVYDAGARRWWWDFAQSYGAVFVSAGEPDWRPLSELIHHAKGL